MVRFREDVKEDKRFEQCNKEMILTLGLFFINFIVVGGPALILGLNKPANEMKFIMGFPEWFFWGGIVGSIIFCLLTYLMVKFLFKEMSIQSSDEEEGI